MIKLDCVPDLPERHDFLVTHIDNHRIGCPATYHFGRYGTQDFENFCLPLVAARATLSDFNLGHLVHQLQTDGCFCN